MNQPNESINLYKTSDLGTATFLFSTGYELTQTVLSGPKRLIFYFKHTGDIEVQVEKYLSGLAQAPARHLFEAYRSLRALAFEKTGNLKK